MRAHHGRTVLALVVFLSLPDGAAGWRPSGEKHDIGVNRAPAIIDNTARMDVNNLDMVVTNHGSFASDLITGSAGLVYPKGSSRTVVFGAGPWIGARVNGEVRVSMGEYSQEFAPGPMLGGTFLPDEPAFKTYTIVRGNTTSPDYLNWPSSQGAPIGPDGKPLLLGDMTMWNVYNDADPSLHTAAGGMTAPLGVEIQQTAFAFNRPGPLGNTIYLKLKMINKGSDVLEDTYFSVWCDPDLGQFTDDLVGCDTTLSLGYCYNGTNDDAVYGASPPAVGYLLLRGPVVPVSPGVFDTLGMGSFNKYINGQDPFSSLETYNYLRGLHPDGSEIHVNDDPFLPTTTYRVSGDPVSGTGWIDSPPSDQRLMLTSGPFLMNPGDEQEIEVAVTIGQGIDRLSSISQLRAAVPVIRAHADGDIPVVVPATVDLDPDVINLMSRAPVVTAYIEVPGFDAMDIDLSSLRLAGSVPAETRRVVLADHDRDGLPDLAVKFGRAALDPLLVPGMNRLEVTGSLTTGERILGADEVRVIEPHAESVTATVAPNPFNPNGTLAFYTLRAGKVRVALFDINGRVVRRLMEAPVLPAGRHEVAIDGRNARGQPLASGTYFFRVETPDGTAVGSVVILK